MTALVALLPVDKSTIFKSEVSVSCKLKAASRISFMNANFCHNEDIMRELELMRLD
jgi:hypothetical protein